MKRFIFGFLNLFKNLWFHKKGRIGLIIISIVIILIILAGVLTPYDPYEFDLDHTLEGPSGAHWLGTDKNGVDILCQILYGGRISLVVGVLTGIGCTLFGAIMGIMAGFFGKVASTIILNVINVLMVVPTLPLMILLNKISSSYVMMIFIFICFGWSGTARTVRSEVLRLKETDYIKQAELNGASKFYIMINHILPGISHLLIMSCALSSAGFMMAEAGLSFMGLGDPSKISWGKMLVAAQENAYTNYLWAWILAPGVALFIVVIAFMQIGFALEDIFNPRMRMQEENYNKSIKIKKEQLDELFNSMDDMNKEDSLKIKESFDEGRIDI